MALTLVKPPATTSSTNRTSSTPNKLSLINPQGKIQNTAPQKTTPQNYTNISGKDYPNASLIKPEPPKAGFSLNDTAKNVFNSLQQAASNTPLGMGLNLGSKTLGVPVAKALQKVPDTTVKIPEKYKSKGLYDEIVEFTTGLPSAMANSWGRSLELLSTEEGRKTIKEGGKNLPQTVSQIKQHLDNKEWGQALQTALDNPALSVALDVSDFLPAVGVAGAGVKKGISSSTKNLAKKTVLEGIEEAEKKGAKQALKVTPGVVDDVVTSTPKVAEEAKKPLSFVKPPETVAKSEIEAVTSLKDDVVEKPNLQQPIGEGPERVSKLGLRVEQTAIEKKLTKDLAELPDYKQMNMKEQSTKAHELIVSDPEKALRVALGEEKAPEGLLPQSVFKAMEASITTPEMAQRLARSPLVSEATALGQKIKALDVQVSDSPVEAIRQVIDSRQKALEKKLGKSVNKASENVVKTIKSNITAPDKSAWGQFLEEIKC